MAHSKEIKTKNKKRKFVTNILLSILLICMLGVIIASAINIYQVSRNTNSGGNTIETETISNEYTNDYYSIGHNATDINKEYFKELNAAIEAADTNLIAESVVKCFVTEYYTWTNKDGNYDVGGMQYIYTDRQSDFSTYSRDNFYTEMDNFLAYNDRSALIEVADVQITGVTPSADYAVLDASGTQLAYPCVTVTATWTYVEDTVMDTMSIQSSATFTVINHDGRMEIAAIA